MDRSSGSQWHHVNAQQKQVQPVSSPILNNGPKHWPFTPMGRCRGVACMAIILSTAFLLIVYLAPMTYFLFGIWSSLWPFLCAVLISENRNPLRLGYKGSVCN